MSLQLCHMKGVSSISPLQYRFDFLEYLLLCSMKLLRRQYPTVRLLKVSLSLKQPQLSQMVEVPMTYQYHTILTDIPRLDILLQDYLHGEVHHQMRNLLESLQYIQHKGLLSFTIASVFSIFLLILNYLSLRYLLIKGRLEAQASNCLVCPWAIRIVCFINKFCEYLPQIL